jgi:hypothetical protein
MTRRPFLVAAAAVAATFALSACSSSGGSGAGGGGGAPPAGKTQSYAFAFTTPPGEETHWCQYTRLPEGDGTGVSVTGYTWSWENMHHWALYRATADLPADVKLDEPFDCFKPDAMKYAQPASLVLAGGATGEQIFPEGTGFAFKAGEIVIVQAHTVNTSSSDLVAKLDMTLKVADPAAVPSPLGLIQFYDPYIVVPALSPARAAMRCAVPQDMTVLFATTHEHTRGTGVQVFLDPADGPRADKPFLESTSWEHPTVIDGPMKVSAGSFIRTSCDYLGDKGDVFQGQNKVSSEMCMFIGYYYPAMDPEKGAAAFENCIQHPIPGGVGDEYGTGTKTCAESLSCIQTCPPGDAPRPGDGRIDVGECWQKCLVGSCPSASAPLNLLGGCVQEKCAEACSGGSGCPACVVSKCGSEYSACQSQGC